MSSSPKPAGKPRSRKGRSSWRSFKFAFIEKMLLPAGLVLLRVLVRTWRLDPAGREELRRMYLSEDRLLVACWHGMFFALMPCAAVARSVGREACVMTSPSRDGLVLDAAIQAIGLRVVKGSSKSRAAAGSFGLVNEIEAGHVGLLAVDGPRGPAAVPKPGFVRIARASRARVVSVTVGCRKSIRFRSWDRLFLPLPFSRVSIRLRDFPLPEAEADADVLAGELRRQMLADAAEVGCPIAQGEKE